MPSRTRPRNRRRRSAAIVAAAAAGLTVLGPAAHSSIAATQTYTLSGTGTWLTSGNAIPVATGTGGDDLSSVNLDAQPIASLDLANLGASTAVASTTVNPLAPIAPLITIAFSDSDSQLSAHSLASSLSIPTAYWQGSLGSGGNATWTTISGGSSNFTTDVGGTSATNTLPDSTTDVHFSVTGGGSNLNTTLGQNFSIKGLFFDATDTSAATIGGAVNTLTIGTDGLTSAGGAGNATISAALALGVPQTWSISNPTVTVSGTITGTGGPLIKSGTGTLVLNGSNSYSGGTTLSNGLLILRDPSALGTGTFTIAGGNIDNNVGAGFSLTTNNAQVWNSDFTLIGTNSLNMGTGAVSLGGSRIVTVNAHSLTVDGVISGSGMSLTKAGAGTMVLGGSNTYSGGTTLSGGLLILNNNGALGTGTFTIAGGNVDNTSGGAVSLANNNVQLWNSDFTFVGTNNLSMGTGAVTLGGNRIVNASANTLTIGGAIGDNGALLGLTKTGAGTLVLNGNNTFGDANPNLAAQIGLQVTGGTVVLNGVNSFGKDDSASWPDAAPVLINGGTLAINNAGALGARGVLNVGAPGGGGGGTLDNTSGGPITVTGNGYYDWTGDVTFAGTNNSLLDLGIHAISLDAGGYSTTTVTVSNGTLQTDGVFFEGILNGIGPAGILKTGPGALVMTSSGSYFRGGTQTNGGTLQLANANALTCSTVTIGISNGLTFLNSAGPTFTIGGLASSAATFSESLTDTSASAVTLAVGYNNASTTYTSTLAGAGGLTKIGTGTLTLTGANTYSGTTTVSAGKLAHAGGSLASPSISVAPGATFSARPGSGTLSYGGTITLNTGSFFDMVDNTIGVYSLTATGATFNLGAASGAAAGLTFEIGNAATGTDLLKLAGGASIGASGGHITIAPLAADTSLTTGNYTFMTASSGLGTAALALASTSTTVNGTQYSFTLANSTSTTEVLTVGNVITNLTAAYWQGGLGSGGNATWTTVSGGSSNFTLDAGGVTATNAPVGSTTDVHFATAAANLNTTLGRNFSIKGLYFDSTGTIPVTINGPSTLTIGADALTAASGSASHSINAPIALGNSQTWTINNPTLRVNGPVSDGGNSFGLTKSGTGTLVLTGANSYLGSTSILAGRLVQAGGSLASPLIAVSPGATFSAQPGPGTLSYGGTITLNTGSNFDMVDNSIGVYNLTGTGTTFNLGAASGAATGLTFELGDYATGTDLLKLAGAASIGASGGQITIAPIAADFIENGDYTFITATSGLGTAALALANTSAVVRGTQYFFSLTDSTSTAEVLSVTNVISILTVAYWEGGLGSGGNATWTTVSGGSSNFTLDAGGVTNTNVLVGSTTDVHFTTADFGNNLNTTLGQNFSIKGLYFDATAEFSVTIGGSNTLTIGADALTAASGSASHTIDAPISLGNSQTWTINNPTLTVNGPVSDGGNSFGLTKSGTGTLVLTGANSYLGSTSISAGRLVQAGGSLASPSIAVSPGATFSAQPGPGTLSYGGTITLNTGSNFDMVDGAIGSYLLTAAETPLVVGAGSGSPAALTFEIGNASAGTDRLTLTSGTASILASGGSIAFTPLVSDTSIVPGNYTFITAVGGLNTGALSLSSTALALNGSTYTLSLAGSTSVAEVLTVALPGVSSEFWKGGQGSGGNATWSTVSGGASNFTLDSGGATATNSLPGASTDVHFTTSGGGSNLNTILGSNISIRGLFFDATATASVTIGGASTLSIGADGITAASGSASQTISAPVGFSADQTWTINNPSLAITGPVSENGGNSYGLTVVGSGNLMLTGSDTVSGNVAVFSGSVILGGGSLSTANLYVGYGIGGIGGSGSLSISNGSHATAHFLTIGSAASGSTTVTGTGSTMTASNGISVGLAGSGSLLISGGGYVSTNGDIFFGGLEYGPSGTGNVTVTGSGSTLIQTPHINPEAEIGNPNSVGSLSITNGGYVQIGPLVISGFGGTGTVLVSGSGSKLVAQASVYDNGTVTINSGGYAELGYPYVNGTASVSGSGSKLVADQALAVGYFGEPGTLTVTNGGQVSCTGFAIIGAGGTGTLTLGSAGTTDSGATLSSTSSIYIGGDQLGDTGVGLVNMYPGTRLFTGDLDLINGTFTIAGGTFASGDTGDNGAIQYTAGTASFGAMSGTGTLTVGAATGAPITAAVAIFFAAPNITINNTGKLAMQTNASGTTSTIGSLTLNGNGTLDIANNIVNISEATTSKATIQGYIKSGYASGNWNGSGINSSSAASNANRAIGYADNADGVVAGLPANTIQVRYTLYGDTNLDGSVNFTDFSNLLPNYNKPATTFDWAQGDFNGDGSVNFTDFSLMLPNYNKSLNASGLAMLGGSSAAALIKSAGSVGPAKTGTSAIDINTKPGVGVVNAAQSNAVTPTVTYILSLNDNGQGVYTPGDLAVYATDNSFAGNQGMAAFGVNITGATVLKNVAREITGAIGAGSLSHNAGFSELHQGNQTSTLTGSSDGGLIGGEDVYDYTYGFGQNANGNPLTNSLTGGATGGIVTGGTFAAQLLLATGTFNGTVGFNSTTSLQVANVFTDQSGDISGQLNIGNGEIVLATQNLAPVPEPAAAGLLTIGAMGLLARRRRRLRRE